MAPKKVIIDTDPGVDDAMAIVLLFNSPEVEVIGLTTVFGNVPTKISTQNALYLCELAGRKDIPVAMGEESTVKGEFKDGGADFVHGTDGLGNTGPAHPTTKPIERSGPQFLVDTCREHPGEVTVIALGPLTNLAKAVQLDPKFAENVAEIVTLGGAFFVNGNVDPACEANIWNDAEAADIVFTCGAKQKVVGINITHQVFLTEKDLEDLRDTKATFGKFLHNISQFYMKYHKESYNMNAVYLHDPTACMAAIDPSLFTYSTGVVRVSCEGITRGMTVLNNTKKRWHGPNAWVGFKPIEVAMTVDADKVAKIVKERLSLPLGHANGVA